MITFVFFCLYWACADVFIQKLFLRRRLVSAVSEKPPTTTTLTMFLFFFILNAHLFTVCILIGSKGQDQTRLNQPHISLWEPCEAEWTFPKVQNIHKNRGISWQGWPKFRFQTPHRQTNPNSANQFLLTQWSQDQMLVQIFNDFPCGCLLWIHS